MGWEKGGREAGGRSETTGREEIKKKGRGKTSSGKDLDRGGEEGEGGRGRDVLGKVGMGVQEKGKTVWEGEGVGTCERGGEWGRDDCEGVEKVEMEVCGVEWGGKSGEWREGKEWHGGGVRMICECGGEGVKRGGMNGEGPIDRHRTEEEGYPEGKK